MAGDANYASVSLLLQGRGADGSTTFTDTSPSPKTVTPTNTTISTAQSKFNGSSMYFNGSSAYLSVPYSSEFVLGSGNATVGMWVYVVSYPAAAADIAVTNTPTKNGYGFRLSSTGIISFIGSTTGYDSISSSSATVLSLSTWHYIEAVRVSGVVTIFVNGVAGGTTSTVATQYNTTGPLVMGRNPTNSSWYFNGYVEGFFLVKGVAEHTTGFTAPSRARADGLGEVEGVIRDNAGSLCARTVRAYRRDTGALLSSTVSDASTGAYLLAMPTLDEVNIVAYDDVSGSTENDRIIRVVPA